MPVDFLHQSLGQAPAEIFAGLRSDVLDLQAACLLDGQDVFQSLFLDRPDADQDREIEVQLIADDQSRDQIDSFLGLLEIGADGIHIPSPVLVEPLG